MDNQPENTNSELNLKRLAIICAGITTAISVVAIAGWLLNWLIIASMNPQYIPMAPSTAVSFFVLGVALFVYSYLDVNLPARNFSKAGVAIILIINFIILIEFLIGSRFDIEQILLPHPARFGQVPIGRMSPITATMFVFSSSALLLLLFSSEGKQRVKSIAAYLAAIVFSAGFVILLGYLHGTPLLYGGTIIPVALTTAIAFVVLSLGLLSASGSDYFPLRLFVGNSVQARLIRAFLPITIVFIVIDGWLHIVAFSHASNFVLVSSLMVILGLFIVGSIITKIAEMVGGDIDRANVQRKQAAEDLKASEERFRTTLDGMMEGCQIIGFDWRYKYLNDAADKHNRRPKEELLGKKYMDMWLGIEATEVFAIIRRCMEERISHQMENEFVFPDGTKRWFALNIEPVREGVFILSIDITERKQAERVTTLTNRIYEIANQSGSLKALLDKYVEEFRAFSGCEAVGIRILDDEGNIPYQAYCGFPKEFYERETSLNIKSDECMCIYAINATINPDLPVTTPKKSFYCNATSKFLATIPEEEKGRTRNVCNQMGYESVALVPFRTAEKILGLVQFNDHRKNMVPLEMVQIMEDVALPIGETIQRKQAENALQESEKRFRELADLLPQTIFEADATGQILFINQRALKMFGYTQQDVDKGMNFLQVLDPSEHEKARAIMEMVMQGKPSPGNDYTMIRKDGSTFPAIIYSSRIIKEGNPAGLRGIIIDITERKKAEEALRKSEEKYRQIVEGLRQEYFFYQHDTSGVFTYLSPSVKDVLGYSQEELRTHYSKYLTDSPINKEVENYTKSSLMGDVQLPYLVEIYHKDKSVHTLEVMEHPVFDEQGKVSFVQGIAHDITEKKLAEDKTKASLKEKELLLKEIYHRVKNNMQIINSLLSLQSKYITDKKALESFEETRSRVLSMALVHEELYSSGDLSRISVSHYVGSMAKQLFDTYNINREMVTLKISIDEDIYLGIDMAVPCGLIISELISNSLKHAFPDGRKGEIIIDFHQDKESTLHMMIKDNGVGMPQEVNFDDPDTFGLLLINILAGQIDANIVFERDGGTTVKIDFKERKQPDRLTPPI